MLLSFVKILVFGIVLPSDDFFYIYIYCKKLNAEFNKLIQAVGHRARFFPKMMLNTPTFCQQF